MKRFNPQKVYLEWVLTLILILPFPVCAQRAGKALSLAEGAAREQLSHKVDPSYPPIARAAQITGDVVLAVTIDAEGKVASEKAISGPAMLQQAALDAVRQWRFTPFTVNGTAVSVKTTLTIPFHLAHNGPQPTPEQEKAAQELFPLENKCRGALKAQNSDAAVGFCEQALDMSLKAGDLTSSDQLGRMDAHQLYGHALLLAGKAQEALAQEDLAVAEAHKCLTDTDEEYAMPYFWRAMAEAHLGSVDATLSDLQISEDTLRRAIIHLPEMKRPYSQYLSSILKQHASLLDQLGRPADAEKLREEAAAL